MALLDPNAPRADRAPHARPREQLVDAAQLATVLGVSRDFVYEHADELGAIRLGSGPRARLRFDVDAALERLSGCSGSRESAAAKPSDSRGATSRRRRRTGTNVELLPIRGDRGGS